MWKNLSNARWWITLKLPQNSLHLWYPDTVFKVLPLLFLSALISEVFLGVGVCWCGYNDGIAVEINFLFIGVSKYLSSKWLEQTITFCSPNKCKSPNYYISVNKLLHVPNIFILLRCVIRTSTAFKTKLFATLINGSSAIN